MKVSILGLCFILMSISWSNAQQSTSVAAAKPSATEQKLIQLSMDKWKWMAEKDVDKLAVLFHEKSKFVHMGGTWKKKEELEVIKSGSIWYKDAKVHDTAVEIIGDVAIVWNRITLSAVVGGKEVVTEFTVTEVYKKQKQAWKLLDLTFSSVRDTHKIAH